MMQPSDPRNRDDLTHFSGFDRSIFWSILFQSELRSVFVVVGPMRPNHSAELTPEEPEPLAMPGQNGGRLHHNQTFLPTIPAAREQHSEDTIDVPKPGARSSVNEARKLVAQRNILGDEICTILEYGGNN